MGKNYLERRWFCVLLSAFLLLVPILLWAHGPNDPPHQVYRMGDFKLESGEIIKDFVISYVTHGKLNDNKSNVILMVPSLGGNHHRIDFLIGPGKALDPEKYFIICADAIGNGLSTSPSNSQAQPGKNFPKFSIRDMVNSQHRFLIEKFELKRVVAVAGASMGGMQGIQWAVSYPDFMNSVIALTGAARASAWFAGVLYVRNSILVTETSWNDEKHRDQLEKGWKAFAALSVLVGAAPEGLNHLFPNGKEIIPYLKAQGEATVKRKPDANDQIYQSIACMEHNVGESPGFNGDYVKALKSIKAKVLLMPGRNDHLVDADQVKEDAKYIKDVRVVEIPTMYGHMGASSTYNPADVDFDNRVVREFLDDVTYFGKKIK